MNNSKEAQPITIENSEAIMSQRVEVGRIFGKDPDKVIQVKPLNKTQEFVREVGGI